MKSQRQIIGATGKFDGRYNLESIVREAEEAGIHGWHVDICKANFAGFASPLGSEEFRRYFRRLCRKPCGVHLMDEIPGGVMESVKQDNFAYCTSPIELANVPLALAKFHINGFPPAFALQVDTPLTVLSSVFTKVHRVLLLTAGIGEASRGFDESVLQKIAKLKQTRDKAGLKFLIGVDGAINPKTARLCAKQGADYYCCSYVFGDPNAADNSVSSRVREMIDAVSLT